MTLDFTPVITSLVEHLLEQDIVPYCMHDGEERIELPAADHSELAVEAAAVATSVDTSRLNCYWHDRGTRHTCSLLLVLGNDPDEVVADYYLSSGAEDLERQLEYALENFSETWSGRPCPVERSAVQEPA
jgi:hypothetical protein